MQELDNTTGAPRQIERRTILKGAAWSVPVIAAAIAVPMASASDNQARIRIYGDCLLNAVGIKVGQGFFVNNQGADAYSGNVTVVETITLTGLAAAPLVRDAVWLLLAVQGILGGNTSGVTRGKWKIANSGGFNPKSVATRTVTLTGPLAAGETRSWGIAANAVAGVIGVLKAIGLGSLTQTATITDPTGNPPVTKSSDTLNWELLSTSC